jgi:cystathionine beta-lyase
MDLDSFHAVDLDALRRRFGMKWSHYGPDVLPAWVADMDFPAAPAVRAAVAAAAARGELGYPPSAPDSGVPAAFAARCRARWGWEPDPALVLLVPNVVLGLLACVEAFSGAGDAVVVTTPAYPPFFAVIERAGRVVAASPLLPGGRVDGDDLAAVMRATRARVVLLCAPHNPTGHVLAREELALITGLAAEHDAIVLSDEIHADLTYDGAVHVPTAALGPDAAARTVTLASASKAFNLAGMGCAVAVAGTAALHQRLARATWALGHAVGVLGIVATLAAWGPDGDEWLAACRAVLDANRRHLAARVSADLPGVTMRLPDATYMAWLDCRGLELGADPAAWFLEHAKVALSSGPAFGPPGAGFARLNFATPPALLDAIIDRLAAAVSTRR